MFGILRQTGYLAQSNLQIRVRSGCLAMLIMAFALSSCTRHESGGKKYSLQTLMSVHKTWGASFSPDEKTIAFVSNRSGQFNIWTVPTSGSELTQLTNFTDAVFFATWCRHENSIIFLRDHNGDENFHLLIMAAAGGDPFDLTPGDSVNSEFLGWAHDGYRFLYHSNLRDRRFFDVYEYDLRTREARMLYEDTMGLEVSAMDRDLTRLAFNRPYTQLDSDVFLYDVEQKALTALTPHEGNVNFGALEFSPDGQELYLLTDKDSEFMYLIKMDLESKSTSEVLRADWDVVWAGFSHNGKYFTTAVNEDGSVKLHVTEVATGNPVDLPSLPEGTLSHIGFSLSELYMTFYFQGDLIPSDLHVIDLTNRAMKRLTNSLPKEIDTDDLVESELIRYSSFDGVQIPAYVYRPKGLVSGEKAPAVLMIHGGPQAQDGKGFGSIKQWIVNQGWVLMVPNVRGSSGYGKTYYSMDDKDWGGAPLQDVIQAKNYLVSTGYVDPDRVVILGGSYGGYMTLAGLAFAPEEFAGGVDICGISNLTSFLESIPPYWEPYKNLLKNEVGDPDTDFLFLKERSPLFSADRIVKPLFVIQGANDPRVKKSESDTIVDAIRARNGAVEYMVFEDEGHGLRKKENVIRAFTAAFAFLDSNVK